MPQNAADSSLLAFLQLLCCGTVRQKGGKAPKSDTPTVKIRMGFDGKDAVVDARGMNVKATFGNFAVLLDSENRLVPLKCDGCPVEPLDTQKRYVVVVNTHGSSKIKWDHMRQKGKHKHKHSHSHTHTHTHVHTHTHSGKKKKKKNKNSVKLKETAREGITLGEKSSNGSDDESSAVPLIPKGKEEPENFTTKDFGVSSSEDHLLTTGDDYHHF